MAALSGPLDLGGKSRLFVGLSVLLGRGQFSKLIFDKSMRWIDILDYCTQNFIGFMF